MKKEDMSFIITLIATVVSFIIVVIMVIMLQNWEYNKRYDIRFTSSSGKEEKFENVYGVEKSGDIVSFRDDNRLYCFDNILNFEYIEK